MARATVLKLFELSPEAAASLEAYARATNQKQTAVIEWFCLDLPHTASPDVQTDYDPDPETKADLIPVLNEAKAIRKRKAAKAESVGDVEHDEINRATQAENARREVADRAANCPHYAKDRVGQKCTACGVAL